MWLQSNSGLFILISARCNVPNLDLRGRCGGVETTKEECQECFNCCWDKDSEDDTKRCYHPASTLLLTSFYCY